MPNLVLRHKDRVSSFRMIAMGTWRDAYDPSVYGTLDLPMDAALAYIQAYRAATGRRLTVSHLMCRAVAAVLDAMPDANAILRFKRIYLRESIGVFFQMALEDAETGQIDLSGLCVREPQTKSLAEILDEFEALAARVRAGKDADKEKTRRTFKRLPGFIAGPVLDLMSLLLYTFNLDLTWAGLPRDPFGSVMITNIGSLGLQTAYVPLVPYSRVPLLLAMGAVRTEPVFDAEGEVVPQRRMAVHATFDHRLLDGAHAAVMAKTLTAWFTDPEAHFGPIPVPETRATR